METELKLKQGLSLISQDLCLNLYFFTLWNTTVSVVLHTIIWGVEQIKS